MFCVTTFPFADDAKRQTYFEFLLSMTSCRLNEVPPNLVPPPAVPSDTVIKTVPVVDMVGVWYTFVVLVFVDLKLLFATVSAVPLAVILLV
jgi:hypothetical protein